MKSLPEACRNGWRDESRDQAWLSVLCHKVGSPWLAVGCKLSACNPSLRIHLIIAVGFDCLAKQEYKEVGCRRGGDRLAEDEVSSTGHLPGQADIVMLVRWRLLRFLTSRVHLHRGRAQFQQRLGAPACSAPPGRGQTFSLVVS